jgi:hypothetical protein
MARGTIWRDAPAVHDGAAGRRSNVAPVCASVAVLMRARTVLGERSALSPHDRPVRASCSAKACCSRSAAA